ncbi:probable ethanolamine kinase isoform X2 [Prunus dulcis]|uniref:probable ethanolamine kinase isoform X2 n=1 Tax=Prunus dulcis TaxID=3755 RepID=UPI0014829F77|nr:probable ethanolamine kinase isoform X2 [Prunus dulcis]
MGGVKNIWNAMEVAKQTSDCSTSQIHSSSLSVDPSLPLSHITPLIIELCKDLFKKWSNLENSHFSVETVSGGITNLLLKVTVKEDNGNDVSVTVRLYGPNTEYVINRERELQSIKYLSAAGFGANLLGVFGNGMVQSFINARTLIPSDMRNPKLAAEIAKQLCRFHQVEIPGSKEPQLWNDLLKFFEKDKLYLIDFEYGSYNYRGFDIGNHFNEYAGYECDFTLCPNKDEQYHFLRHYLQPDNPHEVSEKDLEALYVEENTYTLASHLYWALWGLIQAKFSPINFDYLGYFFLRYNEFKRQKEKCFSLARSFLSRSQTLNMHAQT